MSTNWNDRRFVGSGHAQSTKLHGSRLLTGGPTRRVLQSLGPFSDASFPGVVDVELVSDDMQRLELIWSLGKSAVRLDQRAIPLLCSHMIEHANYLLLEVVPPDHWSLRGQEDSWRS
jgi:hypothetical protein